MFGETENDDAVTVLIYYKKRGRQYTVLSENAFLNIDKDDQNKYSELKLRMKVLTWGIYNHLQEFSGEKFNFKKYKENKLRTLIIEWNAKKVGKNQEEIIVPVTKKSIENLCPEIAEEILKQYDSIMILDQEEEIKILKQVHSYFMGSGYNASAEMNKYFIELQLMEEFHWLPQDIAKIPYKWLQKFFLIRKQKSVTIDQKAKVDAIQNKIRAGSNISKNRGQVKRR
jgi:hypothetical protein